MDPHRWEQIEEVLQEALDVEPSKRAAYIDQRCGHDRDLRFHVEALISIQAKAHTFLESPAVVYVADQLKGPLSEPPSKIGHYRIEARIGKGGMGEVYRAYDETLRRVVALKTLPAEFTSDPERVQRFEQEAFAASRLNHPNIITIFEIAHSDNAHFIVEEYVEGQTLRELLSDPQSKVSRRLSVKKAIDIAIQIASALKAAHTAWIIHRDIKPDNIMVREDGLVKVLDFGIAKLDGDRDSGPSTNSAAEPQSETPALTVPGAIIGTASYMSPEQARGDQLDGRTDLFSLGLLLYEMVIGKRLLTGATRVEAMQAVQSVNETLGNVRLAHSPRVLQRVIRKTLRSDRNERYASASDLLDDLHLLKRRVENRTARRIIGLSALAVIVALALAVFAAILSVNDVWEEKILRDGHTAAVRRAVFSPDGRLLVSVGEDHKVIVWDFFRRERLKTLTDHTGMVNAVAFSPDGKWFVTGSEDSSIIVWDAISFEKIKVLHEHRAPVYGLTLSPSGRVMVSFSTDGEIPGRTFVWNTDGWTITHEFAFGYPYGNHVFLANEQLLVDHASRTWDLITGRQIKDLKEEWSFGWITALDGKRGVGVAANGDVMVIDLAEQKTLLNQHAHHDHGRSVAVSPDGKWLATAAERVVLWDAKKFEKIVPLEYESIVWSVAFSPDSRWLVSTHGDGAILVWDVIEKELVANFREHSGGVRAVAFSGDGKHVATASEDQSIIIWDIEKGQKEAVLYGHRTRVTGVTFSPGGEWLASTDQGAVVLRWDVTQRRPLLTIKPAREFLSNYFVAISPNERFLATTSGVYDAETGEPVIRPLTTFWNQIYRGAFTRDGNKLIGVNDHGAVIAVDTRNWQITYNDKFSESPLVTLSLSPDGDHFATGDDAKTVRLGSVESLRQEAVIGRHQARIKSVAFSPDGNVIASAGDDKMIALWDVSRRKLVATIGTHTSPIYAIAFSPDGKQLVSGEHDRSVRLYTRHRELWGFRLN